MASLDQSERCTWCGREVEPGDGYRLIEHAGERRATFCRLEHVVPWLIQGPHWEPGGVREPSGVEDALTHCAVCGEPLPETRLVLIRHRAEHRIADALCSADHLGEWARRGGRYGQS